MSTHLLLQCRACCMSSPLDAWCLSTESGANLGPHRPLCSHINRVCCRLRSESMNSTGTGDFFTGSRQQQAATQEVSWPVWWDLYRDKEDVCMSQWKERPVLQPYSPPRQRKEMDHSGDRRRFIRRGGECKDNQRGKVMDCGIDGNMLLMVTWRMCSPPQNTQK